MKILVLSEKQLELCELLKRFGHKVLGQHRLLHHSVVGAVSNWKPELIVCLDGVRPESLKWFDEQRLAYCGQSLWSAALSNEAYRTELLKLLVSPSGEVKKPVGQVVNVSGWWNGADFTLAWIQFTARQLMDGDHGPFVDSAWTLLAPLREGSQLFQQTLTRLKPLLNAVKHKGAITIEATASTDKISIHCLACQCFADTIECLSELLGDVVPLLSGLSVKPRKLQAGALHISFAPYPSLDLATAEAKPSELLGVCPENEQHISWLAGSGAVTARGIDSIEIGRRIYRTLTHLGPPSLQYRSDLGVGWTTLLKQLHSAQLL